MIWREKEVTMIYREWTNDDLQRIHERWFTADALTIIYREYDNTDLYKKHTNDVLPRKHER